MLDPKNPKGVMTHTTGTMPNPSGDKPDLERKNGSMAGVGPVSVGDPQDTKASKTQATPISLGHAEDDSKSVHHRTTAALPRARLIARYDQFLQNCHDLLKIIDTDKASVALAKVTAFIDERIDTHGRYAIDLPAHLARALIDARNAGTDALRALRGKNPEATMGDASKNAMKTAIQGLLDHVSTIYRPPTLTEALEHPEQRAKLSKLCETMLQMENFNFLDMMRQARSSATSLPARIEAYKELYPRFISPTGEESINIDSHQRNAIKQSLEMLKKMIDAGDSEAAIAGAMGQVDTAMQVAVEEIAKMLKQQNSTTRLLETLPRRLDI